MGCLFIIGMLASMMLGGPIGVIIFLLICITVFLFKGKK